MVKRFLIVLALLLAPSLVHAQGGQFSLIVSSAEPLPNCTPAATPAQLQPLIWDTTAQSVETCIGINTWGPLGSGGGGIFASFQFGSNTPITANNTYFQLNYDTNFSPTYGGSGTSGSPYIATLKLATSISSNAATATALASTPTLCTTSGQVPNGVDAGGNALNCKYLPITIAATSHEWINSYTASTGLFTETQPAYSDISGTPTLYYQTVVDGAGTTATQQPIIKFIDGTNMTVACVNNAGATRTDCTFTSSATAATAFSAITPATNANAGNFIINGGGWDFTAATKLITPIGAGYAPTASASIGYDSTANQYVFGQNGATVNFGLASSGACATHKWVSTPATGTAVAICTQPAYTDISGTPTLYYQTVQSNTTPQTQEPALNFSTNFVLTTTASTSTNVDLASTISASTSGTAANLSGTPALPNGTTATTQTTGDNTTKLATDAFVNASISAVTGFANTALSNLASVAVNLALTPGTDASINLDSSSKRYVNGYFSGSITAANLIDTTPSANSIAILNGASPITEVLGNITGQNLIGNNAAAPSFSSGGVGGRVFSSGTTDSIHCDSTTATLDRNSTIVYTVNGNVAITVPSAAATGCGSGTQGDSNFTFAVVAVGTGTYTFNPTTSTYTILNGLSAVPGATTLALTAGQYATFNSVDNVNYIVRVSPIGGSGGSASGYACQMSTFTCSQTIPTLVNPGCSATQQSLGAVISANCIIVGNTATVTAASTNTSWWTIIPVANGGPTGSGSIVEVVPCSGVGNLSCSITSTMAGDTLVVDVMSEVGNALSLTTDSGSESYTNVYNGIYTNNGNAKCRMDYFTNTASGITSITGNCSGCGNAMLINVYHLRGMKTSSVLDTYAPQTGFAATTSWVSGTATTTHAADILICSADADNNTSITWTGTSGWTDKANNHGTTQTLGGLTQIVSSVQTSYPCTATASASNEGSMAWAAFEVSP